MLRQIGSWDHYKIENLPVNGVQHEELIHMSLASQSRVQVLGTKASETRSKIFNMLLSFLFSWEEKEEENDLL